MRHRSRIIPVALACIVGAAGLHYRGGLSWAWVALATLLFFAGGALIVRPSPGGAD